MENTNPTKKYRILVVDDEGPIRKLIQKVLQKHNYDVITAANGKEAIEIVKSNPIDLVITDMFMPEKDGIETITDIKNLFPDIHIIAMSGSSSGGNSLLEIAQDIGAKYALHKPFSNQELTIAVEQFLHN